MSHQPAFALVQAKSRLAALERFDVMDSDAEPAFDDLVKMAALICGTFFATITLIDGRRQWFKARVGFDHAGSPLVDSICAATLDQPDLLVIEDLKKDPRTRRHPAVEGDARLRFYARMRLDTQKGDVLGTLCVIDSAPRPEGLRLEQAEALVALGRQVVALLELRRATAERRKQDAVLYEGHARHRAVFDTSYQFQGFLAPDGTLLDANIRALETIQGNLEDVVGLRFWETPWFATTPNMPGQIKAAVLKAAQGTTTRCEIELNLPAGRRIFDFALHPVRDADGAVLGIVPEGIDMTDYRHLEMHLRQSQKLEAVGQLTGGIAHDFNNMLGVVTGFLDLAKRKLRRVAVDQSIMGHLDSAAAGAARAGALTKRLLDFARRQPLDPRPLHLNTVVESLSELLRPSLSQLVKIEFALAPDLWTIFVDSAQMENALINLCVNACDAMPEGGTLRLSSRNAVVIEQAVKATGRLEPGEYVAIDVIDTGIGMEPSVVERAFEPFYTTKGVGHGTGLGLSQVFGFVTKSGGHVTIDSEAGHGTKISVYLPRHLGAVASLPLAPSASCPSLGPKAACVLVVEDEVQIRAMSAELLNELGYRVRVAASPADALVQIERDPEISVLFTDIVMPGMTGPQLARHARALKPTLDVLFTTGCQDHGGLNCATQPDAAILMKPFSLVQLADALRTVTAS